MIFRYPLKQNTVYDGILFPKYSIPCAQFQAETVGVFDKKSVLCFVSATYKTPARECPAGVHKISEIRMHCVHWYYVDV